MTSVYLFVLGIILGFCGGFMLGGMTAIRDMTDSYNEDEDE